MSTFSNWLFQWQLCSGCRSTNQRCFICVLKELKEETYRSPIINPKALYDRISYISAGMELGTQQDAHQFHLAFLNVLENLFLNNENLNHNQRMSNPIAHIFTGLFTQTLTCPDCNTSKLLSVPFKVKEDIIFLLLV